jgi:glycolate oxidase iron-sulfur subunit
MSSPPRSHPPTPRGRPRHAAEHAAFDSDRPPDPELLSDCVHCGFCLPACPTYQLWSEEMDSPRGRILLMDLGAKGERPLTAEMVAHFDSCLGCLACVPACPSGVRYDLLLESTRQQVERRFRRPLRQRAWRRAILTALPHPALLRLGALAAWGAARVAPGLPERLPAGLGTAARLLPLPPDASQLLRRLPAPRRPEGRVRLRVALLGGCVQRVSFPAVNEATAVALAAVGAEVQVPPGQGCCGALEFHAGQEGPALRRARRLVELFDDPRVDRIAVNAAGCGALLKELDRLLGEDPWVGAAAARVAAKTRDVSEILEELGPPATLHELPLRVAYHDACHLSQAQGIRSAPRHVLRWIPGLELMELAEPEICCGSAGTYNLTAPAAARDLGRRKAESVLAAAPQVLAAGNPGCLLQLRSALSELGVELPVVHPVELLAASVIGQGLGRLDGPPPG